MKLTATIFMLAISSVIGQGDVYCRDDIPNSKFTYTYKNIDGLEIKADVYKPAGNKVRPAIIWIHGGALIFGSRSAVPKEQLLLYLKSGYVVVSIDYRLAPETKLKAIIEDIEDAYHWVYEKGPELFQISPDRLAIIGHSAGGYLALMAGFRLYPRPKALISFYGYGDITGPWIMQPDSFYLSTMPIISKEQADEYIGESEISNDSHLPGYPDGRAEFYLYCRQQGLWTHEVSGSDSKKNSSWLQQYEPIKNVSPVYSPTLLLHGEQDTDVPFEQSLLMAKALEKNDVECKLISNPDWEHMFDLSGMGDAEVLKAFKQVLAFLEKHLIK